MTNTSKSTTIYPLFKDIGGYEEAKKEAKKITTFFKNYQKFSSKGAKLYKGAIFYGFPGTGKTLFSKAIANEAGVPLFQLTSDEFCKEDSYSETIKSLFEKAKNNAPSIILIDEIDRMVNCDRAFAKNETDKQRETLRVLLTEIDKLNDAGVIVIATANVEFKFLPPALVRNGRIEKHIELDIPEKDDRISILDLYLKKHSYFKNIATEDIASYTSDFTGASLATLINDVLIQCISNDRDATFNDFLPAIESIREATVVKQNKSKNTDPTIYHELGHFIVDYKLNNKIGMINVVPYSTSTGRYSRVDVDESVNKSFNKSYTEIYNDCVVSVAGLVATEVFLGETYAGASSDMEKITGLYFTLAKNGMLSSEETAMSHIGTIDYNSPYLDFKSVMLEHYSSFLDRIKAQAKGIIESNKSLIEILYKELKAKSVLTHFEISDIVKNLSK